MWKERWALTRKVAGSTREELGFQNPASSQVTGKAKSDKGTTEAAAVANARAEHLLPPRAGPTRGRGCRPHRLGLGFPEASPAQLLSFPGQTAPTSGPGDSASARGRDSEKETGSSKPGGGARQRHAGPRH